MFVLLSGLLLSSCQKSEQYTITQYGMEQGSQAMFYTIKSSDGKLVVIDGGIRNMQAM